MPKLTKVSFLIIVLLAAVLRFWSITATPPGLTWDEAALGYNAYSILKTGKDEYGNFLPLVLKSFGDYKPALYAYLTIPFVAILGLTELAVRMPSVLAGIATIILVFFLFKKLLNEKTALCIAFLLAISPLHLQFSRPGFESNIAVFLNVLAAFLLLKDKKKWQILSFVIFGLSILTYQSSKLFVPLFLILLLIYKRDFWKTQKKYAVLGLSFLIFVIFFTTFFIGEANRLATLNIFAYPRTSEYIQQISNEDGQQINSFTFQILHGEWWAYVRGLYERLIVYLSPKVLFITGDVNPRNRVPDLGVTYYFSLILVPLGLYFLIKNKSKLGVFIISWFILGALPSILARDLMNFLRALNLVIPLAVLEGVGLFFLIQKFKSYKKLFYPLIVILFGVILVNFSIYIDRYFIHAPKEYSKYWLYGYKQVMQNLSTETDKYDKVVITDHYGQPYIYYLFYNQYPPEKFQKQAVLHQEGVDVGTIRRIDNIEFKYFYWPEERKSTNNLYIGTFEELPENDLKEADVLKEVKFLDGIGAFRMVSTK